jgi:hypothetical protein
VRGTFDQTGRAERRIRVRETEGVKEEKKRKRGGRRVFIVVQKRYLQAAKPKADRW